jgi:hypothetical protein
MPFNIDAKKDIDGLTQRAFRANRQAKLSRDHTREGFYRTKDAAINTLLKTGRAFVNGVDWSAPDPTVGISFVGGGRLHTKLSALDLSAFRNVRRQLAAGSTRQDGASGFDYREDGEGFWRN